MEVEDTVYFSSTSDGDVPSFTIGDEALILTQGGIDKIQCKIIKTNEILNVKTSDIRKIKPENQTRWKLHDGEVKTGDTVFLVQEIRDAEFGTEGTFLFFVPRRKTL